MQRNGLLSCLALNPRIPPDQNDRDNRHRKGPCQPIHALAIDQSRAAKGDEGLEQLRLAHPRLPAHGKPGIPEKETDILAHKAQIDESRPMG